MLRCAQTIRVCPCIMGVASIFILAACGYNTSIRTVEYEKGTRPKEYTMGLMRFDDVNSDDDYEVHLDRIRGGYSLNTPVYEDDDSNVKAIVSKTRDHKWFAGMQMRWEF